MQAAFRAAAFFCGLAEPVETPSARINAAASANGRARVNFLFFMFSSLLSRGAARDYRAADGRCLVGSFGEPCEGPGEHVDGQLDVRRQGLLLWRMADPTVQAADEEHRRRDACARERIDAAVHRNGAGVADVSLEGALAADDADDPHREPQRGTRPFQHGSLLDVHLEEALRQLAALDEGGAADAAALFVAEDDHCARADALDRLDRGDDPERTVELPSERHRVKVRAGPDARLCRAADEIRRLVDLDLEPGLPHPPRGQLVRPVFALGAGHTVGSDATADGVELVEP